MYCFSIKIEKFRACIKSSFPPNPNKIHFSALLHWDMCVLLRMFHHVDQDFQNILFCGQVIKKWEIVSIPGQKLDLLLSLILMLATVHYKELFCGLFCAKQYIYYQRLTNEYKIDFLSYLLILKNKSQIEKVLCAKENNHNKFNKFKFIFEDLLEHLHICVFSPLQCSCSLC